MSDIYENVTKGALKLKGVSDGGVKKKKKKSKKSSKEKTEEAVKEVAKGGGESSSQGKLVVDKRTKAEIAYQKKQEERAMERIMKKASKTHKERIMDFNSQLDSLTEHYDIPKVSWTK